MGANAVNTMAELIAPEVERLTGGRVHLKILSNLAAHRLREYKQLYSEELANDGSVENGQEVIGGIIEAHHFAVADHLGQPQ